MLATAFLELSKVWKPLPAPLLALQGPILQKTAKNPRGKNKPPNPPSHLSCLLVDLNCHDSYNPPKWELSFWGVSNLIARSQECSLSSNPILTSSLNMSFFLPAGGWQGRGETGARACHAIWHLLPLTQPLSVVSSSGYTEMSGWHEPAVFCIAACIFNVIWQLYPEWKILVCSENHSEKQTNK